MKTRIFLTENSHLYGYCSNNPVRYVDPEGRFQTIKGEYIFFPNRNSDNSLRETPLYENSDVMVVWGFLLTNTGNKIECFYKNDRTNKTEYNYDCHGLTFTNGTFWINNEQVEKILTDDGYVQVDIPRENDILIQRDSDGNIFHSATVLEFDEKNKRVLVKEAMGSYKFGGNHDINKQWYTIDSNRDSFYKRGQNKDVEIMPKILEE